MYSLKEVIYNDKVDLLPIIKYFFNMKTMSTLLFN